MIFIEHYVYALMWAQCSHFVEYYLWEGIQCVLGYYKHVR